MTDREQFEQLFPIPRGVKYNDKRNEYLWDGSEIDTLHSVAYNFRWEAWEASRAVPVRLPRPFYDDDGYPIIYADRAADAIRKAGYKVEGDA
jgi:hypothetical protein